ncbi:MAG: glucokinase [Synechococcaceae cyanobacterium]|nr:glucokinase [Synechococcaceae cyanobacterium]
MTLVLAGDIGGTKTLLGLYRCRDGGQPERCREQRYPSAEWPDLARMVQAFLAAGAETDGGHPRAACFAVAGPVRGGQARLTNLPWNLRESDLAAECAIPQVELVNDFAVLVHGLPHLRPDQVRPLHAGEADAAAPCLVLGAGTGLGVAIGIPTAAGLQAMASEASHGEFAPRSAGEWRLRQWLLEDLQLERLSSERIVSGTGLGHVARWFLAEQDVDPQHPLQAAARRWLDPEDTEEDLPARVAILAAAGDPLARAALDLWLGAYGSLTGDLALATLARGGIWLAGGTAAKLLDELGSERFRQPMLAKGRLSGVLEDIPVTAITDAAIGSFSAACRARALLE